jgi:hypothetical protein
MNNYNTENIEISNLIEQNLHELYISAAKDGKLKFEIGQNYSWVKAHPFIWPNYIFQTNINFKFSGDIIHQVSELISKDIAPPFWIINASALTKTIEEDFTTHNIKPVMQWPGMAIELKTKQKLALTEHLKIIRINSIDKLTEWIRITEKCLFNDKKQNPSMLATMMKNPNTVFLLALLNGKPAGTALVFINNEIGGFYMISTLPEYRNKGMASSIMLEGLNIIKEENCSLGILQANKLSLALYKSLGFKAYCDFVIYWKMKA